MSAFQDADVVEVEKEVKLVLKDIHNIAPEDDQAIGAFNLGEVFKKTIKFADGLTFLSLLLG